MFIIQIVINVLLGIPPPNPHPQPQHTSTKTFIPSGKSFSALMALRIIISIVFSTEKDKRKKSNPQLRPWLLIIFLKPFGFLKPFILVASGQSSYCLMSIFSEALIPADACEAKGTLL